MDENPYRSPQPDHTAALVVATVAGAVAFECEISESHAVEGFRRYRRSRSYTRLVRILKYVAVFFFALGILGALSVQSILGILLFTVFIGLLLTAHRIDEWLVRRRIRRSPGYGYTVRIQLSTDGCTVQSKIGNASLPWAAFSAARRSDDGVLLFQGPALYYWLPEAAIVQGNIDEADDLGQANIADYRRI